MSAPREPREPATDDRTQPPAWWREPTRAQWAAFLAAWVGWVLDAFDFTIYLLVVPELTKEFGVSATAAMGSLTLTLLVRLLGGVAAGWLADRYGRKLPLMLAMIWFAVFDALVAGAPTFTWVLVLRTLFGFGMGAEWTAGSTLAMESWPARSRGVASGLLQGSWAIGFLLAALASAVVVPRWGWRALFLVRFVGRPLRTDLRARLGDIVHIGAAGIDVAAYDRLAAATGPDASAAAVAAAEASDDYRRISAHLNTIRSAEPKLLRYAYTLMPSADPDHPRFVVDADVLAGAGTDQELSHWNQPYDVTKLPALKRALAECRPILEDGFVWDPDFKVYSVSAYYPVGGGPGPDGRCRGVLGVDITDRDMRAALDEAGRLALRVSLAVIVLALIVSVVMGTLLTRSIMALSTTVERFANKDFAARTSVASKDEIGQLGRRFNVMAETIQVHSENLEHLVAERTSELEAEKQTSERLLLNVLPSPIADRLKLGEGVIVDRFDQVTVLFADIVGFTALSSRTTPEALVSMLNELFSAFDKLAEEYGLEKIKTIGDAYMVVAGIPQARADHADAMIRMAQAMLDAIAAYARKTGGDLTIRVGLHSGSVVAGVIGTKKFIYDLWGDTVNTASRMESSGVPGRVHVSEATYVHLRDGYDFEPPRTIDIKGKGLMSTYILVGPKSAS